MRDSWCCRTLASEVVALTLSSLLASLCTKQQQQLTNPPGQLQLKNAAVLIVGAGGLGCSAAAYLAGAGVGTLGIADGDTVELSNLHRQIGHATSRVGMGKADSLIRFLRE